GRGDSRCTRWACRGRRRGPAAARGSRGRDGGRRPCRAATACGTPRSGRRPCPGGDDDGRPCRTSPAGGTFCTRRCPRPAGAGRALTVGPGEVPGAGSVAGLAGDVDLRPARREAVVLRVVFLPDAGRMALGAHVVPVLRRTGPVQHVVEVDLVLWIEVEPPLPARG